MKTFEIEYLEYGGVNGFGGLSFMQIQARTENKARKEFGKMMKGRRIKFQSIKRVFN
ncbi:MAG: hypothetical protein MJ176_03295 [Treponema sp.]|jgi:hypothetical protein|nr:hypothetical protein [Treponema sp.]